MSRFEIIKIFQIIQIESQCIYIGTGKNFIRTNIKQSDVTIDNKMCSSGIDFLPFQSCGIINKH